MEIQKQIRPNQIRTIEDVILHKGEEWRKVLEDIRQTISIQHLTDRNLVRLTKGAATIEQTYVLVKLIARDIETRPIGTNAIDVFFRVVDYSNYNLGSWLKGIVYFDEWLEKQNRKTSFQKMLGYLQCCEESPEDKEMDYKFIDLVSEMLEKNGYID